MGACCAADELPTVDQSAKKGAKAPPQGSIKADAGAAAAEAAAEPEPAKPALKDLAPPKSWGLRDEIQAFEQNLPFNRIEVSVFMDLVDQATAAQKERTGVENAVTLATLSEFFDSPAWEPLKDSNSVLSKLLLHSRFHEEDGTPADHVDSDILKCFGLFHNQGKDYDKAVALYNILQEGGLSQHEQITATDKDFKPNFIRLASLATKDIFKLAHELGSDVPDYYDDDECARMISEDNMEQLIEEEFLEAVYGAKSRLENEVWLKNVSDKKSKWIFTVDEFRE